MFDDFDLLLIAKFAIGELLIGIISGIIFKLVIKFNADRDSNCQIFESKAYSSIEFGKFAPRHFGDAFLFSPEFVIVRSSNGEVISEKFLTFLGASSKFVYENGISKGGDFLIFTYPVYLSTVILPIIVGFFPSLLPFIGKFFSPLLYSGIAWLFLTFLLQALIGLLRQTLSNLEPR
ncbi:hypothetical protein [Chamaesiphon sp. VAR_48_metabat_403]|uniref:hypothetical protein n=1 Tax=Chamaesiphon sp. VAR_48_metabat_403 TaxID=2964700 RepID=UPI00286E31DE|nr:hypothetical protein [Chamaesiphon sp. VAR_48_metabat_403]